VGVAISPSSEVLKLVRPRLTDYYNVDVLQEQVDFAIPFLEDDIPLAVDPFLLWRSPSQQDRALHLTIANSFNRLAHSFLRTGDASIINTIRELSDCYEVGLGFSKNRHGTRIDDGTVSSIIDLYRSIPQIGERGIVHLGVLRLLVNNIGPDRISDFTCSILKSFLIDFTIEQCGRFQIPTEAVAVSLFDSDKLLFRSETVSLPVNPSNNEPLLLVPKRWLRRTQWIDFDDYYEKHFTPNVQGIESQDRLSILTYNRANYGQVEAYITLKEASKADCTNDPLFKPIPITSAKQKLTEILKLPTGKGENADKRYEDLICSLFASILYPHLDFADMQSRTESGTQIRDLIFYNNRQIDFLHDIFKDYDSRQIVFELKNVAELSRDHINQLSRYLTTQFGRFGFMVTRKPPKKNIYQNTIDLWSGQRRCIIILTDLEVKQMCDLYETRQRLPYELLKAKYIQFTRDCPA
jgi:hypothetical protein